MNINLKHRKAISYAHFVNQEEDDFIAPYNPDYIENATEPASFFQSAQVCSFLRISCFFVNRIVGDKVILF